MGKASRTKRERRSIEGTIDDRQREWDNLSDEEKAQREARMAEFEAEAKTRLTQVIGFMRERKERRVKETTAEQNDDVQPWLDFERDDRLVATVICRDVDRDQALRAAGLAVPGYGADTVTLTVDAHMSNQVTNPRTGKEWRPHEMQGLCDNEGACDLGLITDTLWVVQAHRDGHLFVANAPYHVHKSARSIAWSDDPKAAFFGGSDGTEGDRMEGLIPDVLRECFERPPLRSLMDPAEAGALFGLDPHRAVLHMDLAVTKMLMGTGEYSAVMLGADNEEDAAVIQESMADAGNVFIDKIDMSKH